MAKKKKEKKNSIPDSLLASISFSCLVRSFPLLLIEGFFHCLPILGDSYLFASVHPNALLCQLFSWGEILWQECCGTQWCGLFDLLVWMLQGCPFFCLCGLSCSRWVFTCWWFLCWWVLSSSRYIGVHSSHLLFYVIGWRGKAKWIKTEEVYSMRFKVPTGKEEIGDPLDMYSVNHDISLNQPLFRNTGKKIRLLLGVGRIMSWIQKAVSLWEVRL